ncbi:MAG: NADH-quinone oxidoreductase subunit L [Deltaproteobacteria bacterium]|nr:NADH-quinone oxidoreductase subunit L [Deltaproteobacteria bacterium]
MLGLMLALPLAGFLVNGVAALGGRKVSAKLAGTIASAAIFGSFLIAVSKFLELRAAEESARIASETVFQWITVGDFSLPFKLTVDPLGSVMTLVVTGVGFLIHVYSIGYMDHDRTPPKFFAYLNLFTFAMLALVLGASFPVLFLGWEGVGLCSYLLIGYWYDDIAKASAGKKAFVVNRIGDLGFLVGIFILFGMFGTLDFAGLKEAVHAQQSAGTLNVALLTAATMCLFIGAMGKSAQIPLYVWLPDAMAGPTPVSALIHAATMVTAGVYMVARLNFLFSLCPESLMLVSGTGAATAIFAATIAIVQRDIKKVLAYSTVSQLGYMFMAVGVGAYAAGIFHLVTHAFFKALLFLGSGSVIHGMHEEQDILKMGGLKKYMPRTYVTFVIGTIAIAGIPPLAGFFSKDEILWEAFSSRMGMAGPALWAVGALTALLTAFYMTRLTCLTFLGKPRFDPHHAHPHESPNTMVVPLMILAALSIVGGFLGVPGHSMIGEWLIHAEPAGEAHDSLEYVLMTLSALIAFAGVGLGYFMYVKRPDLPEKFQSSLQAAYRVLFNKYYIDELYEALLVRPVAWLADVCWKIFDVIFVDGFVLGLAKVSKASGEAARLIQTGAVQIYAAFILTGLIATVGYFIYVARH